MTEEHAYAYELGYQDGYVAREAKIVRCRDCEHYDSYQCLCERLKPARFVFEADGFCAWSSRRDDAE